jgi:hemolysin III
VSETFETLAGAPRAAARPLLRGVFHLVAFVVSIPAGVALVRAAHDDTGRIAAVVFSAGLVALYGVSAAYHRITWTPEVRMLMRRADHSTIFVLIAASYTAVGLLVLDPVWQRVLLTAVWAGSLAGIALKIAAPVRTRRITGTMYIVLGWLAVAAVPQFLSRADGAAVALIVAGGLLYTGGAIVFALRRPNPSPRVFGYHEIWHAAVVAAGVCHYCAVWQLLARNA